MNSLDCIVTDRLILRRLVNEDAQDVLNLMGNDYIAEKIGLKPFRSITEGLRFIRNWRFDSYAVTERDSDRVIGIIQLPVLSWRKFGLGYWLDEEYRGRGYMTEAVEAVKDYVFKQTAFDEVELFVYCGNDTSRNLALHCGFFPDYERFREEVYSPYGKVESEEIFTITRADYEWDRGYTAYRCKAAA